MPYFTQAEADAATAAGVVFADGVARGALFPASVALPAPVDVIASAGAASGVVDVQWSHRQSQSVSSYTVTSSTGASVTVQANGLARQSARVSNLTNGALQTFTVRANNVTGASVASNISNAVTPTALPATILPVTRGLEFWWSARQVVAPPADGIALPVLTDFSGNGYDAAPRTGTVAGGNTKVPLWKASGPNGKPGVQSLGYGERFDTQASGFIPAMRNSAVTVCAVYAVTANGNAAAKTSGRVITTEGGLGTALPNGGLGAGFAVGATAGQANPQVWFQSTGLSAPAATTTITGPTVALGAPVVQVATFPGSLRVNGAAVASSLPVEPINYYGSSGSTPAIPYSTWSFLAEQGDNGNYGANAVLAEVIIFSEALTTTEITSLETYLAGAY